MISNVYLDSKQRIAINCASHKPSDVYEAVSLALHLSTHEFYLTQNGRRIIDTIDDEHVVRVHLRMLGGKGGFGSMLRAIGAQIEKTTNREACRDLSGRRLRDINEEKRMKEWLEKQGDQDESEEAKMQRKIAKLRAAPKHEFKDNEYFEARTTITDELHDAVEEGLKNALALASSVEMVGECSGTSSSGGATKRKTSEPNVDTNSKKKKKKKMVKGGQWLEDLSSSDDSSDDDSEYHSAVDTDDKTSEKGGD